MLITEELKRFLCFFMGFVSCYNYPTKSNIVTLTLVYISQNVSYCLAPPKNRFRFMINFGKYLFFAFLGSKETAFTYAISAAGVVVAVARACKNEQLRGHCGCSKVTRPDGLDPDWVRNYTCT